MAAWSLRRLATALMLMVASVATLAADLEYPPLSVVLKPLRVGVHSWYVQGQSGVASPANEGYNSNAGFVITPAGVVVIDALGTPALGKALIAAIGKLTKQPVRRLILTHYHADHFYGAQAFKEAGAEIWAQAESRDYLQTAEAAERRAQRARDLAPWINDQTRLLAADHWVGEDESFVLGGLHFELTHLGPAHAPEDLVVLVREDQVLYSGDLLFSGRIPFIGSADSRRWLATIGRLMEHVPRVMVVGHGAATAAPAKDLMLTRDYLAYLREQMGRAVTDLVDFDAAYGLTDWSRWSSLPAFDATNRRNAYNVYLQMEQEALVRGRDGH